MTIEEILGKVPEKGSEIMTTSKTLKKDVYEFFHKPEFADKMAFEFGCYHGHTTIVLAHCFKSVYCFDNWDSAIESATGFLNGNEITNVTIFKKDLYDGSPLPVNEADIIFIDSMHNYDGVKSDIDRFLKVKSTGKKWFILDDYRLCPEIRRCVNDFIHSGILRVVKGIGTYEGAVPDESNWEGIILSEV